MARRELPTRRGCESIDFEHEGMKYLLTVGRFPDTGEVAEIFINTQMKSGSLADVSARDGAVAISLALQWGVPLEIMRAAMARTPTGAPQGPLAAALDAIEPSKVAILQLV